MKIIFVIATPASIGDSGSVRCVIEIQGVHFNPVSSLWKLSEDDLDYYYSSARLYENGVDGFGFLFDIHSSSTKIEKELFRVHRTKAYNLSARVDTGPRPSGVMVWPPRIERRATKAKEL